MPARARSLTRAGTPVMAVAAVALGCVVLLTACGGLPGTSPSPSGTPNIVRIPTPSPALQIVGTTRTVVSPLGLRVHSTPVLEFHRMSSAGSRRGDSSRCSNIRVEAEAGIASRARRSADGSLPTRHSPRQARSTRSPRLTASRPCTRRTGDFRTSRSELSSFPSRGPGRASSSRSPTASSRSGRKACPDIRNRARQRRSSAAIRARSPTTRKVPRPPAQHRRRCRSRGSRSMRKSGSGSIRRTPS